ncbi:MAG: hypothetical protein MI751_05065, partial [Pseudomonadales bacterium]|nr:hypothetical protein [Pseudomonadales bacterium]
WARLASPGQDLPACWGRQSRFIKRGAPLLVAEYFLPALWEKVGTELQATSFKLQGAEDGPI